MIHILYFASLRDRVGTASEALEITDEARVGAIVEILKGRGGAWAEAFGGKTRVLAAVNQEMSRPEDPVKDGDELAFFPPVTGG